MDIRQEEIQRQKFRDILFKLARSQDLLSPAMSTERYNIYKALEDLYRPSDNNEGFRHFYSDIFSVLNQIYSGDKDGEIEILGQNIFIVRQGYQPNKNKDEKENPIDISNSIRKLYDHVSLDIARLLHATATDRYLKQEDTIESLNAKVNELKIEIGNASKQNAQLKKSLDNSQEEYITILGIFAAVVLAFTGGLAFSTSVLENIANIDVFTLVPIVCLIAFTLINTIGLLLKFIFKINGREEKLKLKIWLINLILFIISVGTLVFKLAICCYQ